MNNGTFHSIDNIDTTSSELLLARLHIV